MPSLLEQFRTFHSPLQNAVYFDDRDFMLLCIRSGCDVDVDYPDCACGMSALNVAAHYGRKEAVGMLIDAGCFLQDDDDDHISPASVAAHRGHCELSAILTLATEKLFKTKKNRLLDSKYNTSRGGTRWNGAPHACAYFGDSRTIHALIKLHKYDFEETDADGLTPFSFAVIGGHLDVVKLLLGHGCAARGHAVDKLGRTPVAHACINGHRAIMLFLMTTGSDVAKPDNDGLAPIDHFMRYLSRTYNMTVDEAATGVRSIMLVMMCSLVC